MSTETPRYDKLEPRHSEWSDNGRTWPVTTIVALLCDTLSSVFDAELALAAALTRIAEQAKEIERLRAQIAAKDEAIKRLNGWLDNARRALGEEG